MKLTKVMDVYGVIIYVPGFWFSSPPSPNGMVWYGGGAWRVRRGVGAVGAAAGETARRHRPQMQALSLNQA